jgi:hypothetical protein
MQSQNSIYAAKVENNVCIEVICGNANWATERLGGTWISCSDLVGIGWVYDGNSFVQPIAIHPPISSDPLPTLDNE